MAQNQFLEHIQLLEERATEIEGTLQKLKNRDNFLGNERMRAEELSLHAEAGMLAEKRASLSLEEHCVRLEAERRSVVLALGALASEEQALRDKELRIQTKCDDLKRQREAEFERLNKYSAALQARLHSGFWAKKRTALLDEQKELQLKKARRVSEEKRRSVLTTQHSRTMEMLLAQHNQQSHLVETAKAELQQLHVTLSQSKYHEIVTKILKQTAAEERSIERMAAEENGQTNPASRRIINTGPWTPRSRAGTGNKDGKKSKVKSRTKTKTSTNGQAKAVRSLRFYSSSDDDSEASSVGF